MRAYQGRVTEKTRAGLPGVWFRASSRALRRYLMISIIIIFGSPIGILQAQNQNIAAQPAHSMPDVGIDQRLNNQVPLDLVFKDEAGRAVPLRQYFAGKKPVILSLVYFSCPMLCTQVLKGLTDSLSNLRFNVGDEFEVVTVSFDPRDTPERAADQKEEYITRYGRAGAGRSWHFLTGDEASIKSLAGAVGFRYQFDEATNQFAHASGIMVLTPEGKVSRYFYGIQYPARDLRLGLVEASDDKIGSFADQVLLLCYHYDPATGKYGVVTMNLVRIGGALTILILGGVIFRMLRKDRSGTQGAGHEERNAGEVI